MSAPTQTRLGHCVLALLNLVGHALPPQFRKLRLVGEPLHTLNLQRLEGPRLVNLGPCLRAKGVVHGDLKVRHLGETPLVG